MNDTQMVKFSEQVVEAVESLGSLKQLGCTFSYCLIQWWICQICLVFNSIHLVVNWNNVGYFLFFFFASFFMKITKKHKIKPLQPYGYCHLCSVCSSVTKMRISECPVLLVSKKEGKHSFSTMWSFHSELRSKLEFLVAYCTGLLWRMMSINCPLINQYIALQVISTSSGF